MSKKTFFKRIALTAIAALGFGMLSVAPSKALIVSTSVSFDADDTLTLAGTSADSATAVLTFNQNALSATDSQTVKVSITSSNGAGVTNLYMRVTETSTSSTPLGTTGGETTSPFIYFGAASSGTSTAPAALVSRAGYDAGVPFDRAAYDSITVAPQSAAINSSTVKMTVGLYKITSAGTYTVKATVIDNPNNGTGGTLNAATATWTVTVSAAAVTTSTANSTATLRTGNPLSGSYVSFFNGTAEATDSQTLGTATSTATDIVPEFTLLIRQKDANATNAAKESYTVTVSGEAFVTKGTEIDGTASSYSAGQRPLTSLSGSNTVVGTKYLRMATNVADTVTAVHIWSTGTAGTATITATSDGGVVLATKTVTFAGKATTLTVSRTTKKVIEAGTADGSSAAFRVTATDAGGRAVPGLSGGLTIVSSNVAAISGGSCADAFGAVTDGIYSCDLNTVATSTSGMAATLTVRYPDPAVTTATVALGPWLTTTYDVKMGGAVEKFVLTTDKATYDPGTAMVVTATAKDDAGNTPYDGQEGPTLRANKQLGGTAAGSSTITMNAYYDGVSTSQTRVATSVRTFTAETTLYAPAASGAFTITGLDGQLTPAEVKVTATVGDDGATAAANAASDAAAEAIDAANAATDAANLAAEAADAATVAAEEARDAADAATAAVEALATEVATLMAALKAQITTLANTVAKIAKKVKA